MQVPASKNVVTSVVISSAALLLAAASPTAVAPEMDELAACVPPAPPRFEAADDPAQRALVQYVSRRFLVASPVTQRMVAAAHRAAETSNLDPLLVLAVIAVESRFNPIAESSMGARGLMQIIPRYHLDKLRAAGGEDAVFDPEANIMVGARILQEYIYRGGTLEAGLQQYNGALRDPSAYYAQRVMAERERFEQVVRDQGLVQVATGT